MEIYDLFGNDGLASGVYRCRAAGGGLNFKICSIWLDRLRDGGNFIADLSSWRSNGGSTLALCIQHTGLVASGRERCVGLCGACCCCGSGDRRRSIDGGSDEAAVAGLLIYNQR